MSKETITDKSNKSLPAPVLWRRAVAYMIDSALITIVGNIFIRVFSNATGQPYYWDANTSSLTMQVSQLIYFLVGVIYGVYFLSQNKGITLGKKIAKIQVVRSESPASLDLKTAVLRETAKLAIYIFFIFNLEPIGLLYIIANILLVIFSKKRQGIHDRIAHTRVISSQN